MTISNSNLSVNSTNNNRRTSSVICMIFADFFEIICHTNKQYKQTNKQPKTNVIPTLHENSSFIFCLKHIQYMFIHFSCMPFHSVTPKNEMQNVDFVVRTLIIFQFCFYSLINKFHLSL